VTGTEKEISHDVVWDCVRHETVTTALRCLSHPELDRPPEITWPVGFGWEADPWVWYSMVGQFFSAHPCTEVRRWDGMTRPVPFNPGGSNA
jgi:hypothetical protein